MELSTSLEDEKNHSAFLEMSLETEKDKNDESAKTEKIVAHQLKGALDVVQVLNIGWSRICVTCDVIVQKKKFEWILAYLKNFSKNNPIKSFVLKRRWHRNNRSIDILNQHTAPKSYLSLIKIRTWMRQ